MASLASGMLVDVNYLAHGIRYLDRPYFLIGSALPDLLSVVNRRSRVRRRTLEGRLSEFTGEDRELVLGMLQHLHDDQWFHGTPGFYETTSELSRRFREVLGPDDDWNCSFLGHLVTELLIDATLSHLVPGSLTAYYTACQQVHPQRIQDVVSAVATEPPLELARFIERFIQERFLEDYTNNERLLYRLNQVMRRVGIPLLPASVLTVLESSRDVVRDRLSDLLPETHFTGSPLSQVQIGSARTSPPKTEHDG